MDSGCGGYLELSEEASDEDQDMGSKEVLG